MNSKIVQITHRNAGKIKKKKRNEKQKEKPGDKAADQALHKNN